MKESDLANIIIKHFEKDGYVAYKEVSKKGRGGNSRADIYLKSENEYIVIETKMNLSLKVLEQAHFWKSHSNKCYIGVPSSKLNRKSRLFAREVCKSLGIGLIEVGKSVNISVDGDYRPKCKVPPLYEEQKDSIAGNSEGKFYTSFQNTVKLINEYMDDKECEKLLEVVKNIKHHYKNNNSAKSSLKKYIEGDIIKGYDIIKEGSSILIKKST